MKYFTQISGVVLVMSIFFHDYAVVNVRFGSGTSSLTAGTNGILNIKSDDLYIKNGNINKFERGKIKGSPIYFEDSYFTTGLSESYINGLLDPSFEGEVVSEGRQEIGQLVLQQRGAAFDSSDFFMANPGGVLTPILVRAGHSILRGQPLFFGENDIQFEDSTSMLAIAVQNTVNSNIVLNGGLLFLQSDLSLGDEATIVGGGHVVFNGRRVSLGGTASNWSGNLLWDRALDLQINSRVELEGRWAFYQDCQVNGNGNVLNLANGGVILVYPNSRLRLTGVRLKGLGTGKIIMAPSAQLILSDVEIEMNDNYDIYAGGIYIDGATTIITKDKLLTFRASTPDDLVLTTTSVEDELKFVKGLDTHGSLTIDRVALTYDPLEFVDRYNIRPLRILDPNHKFINIINHGSIRKFRMESISFLDYSSDTALQRYAVVFPVRPIKIFPEVIDGRLNYDVKVHGNSNYYRFTEARQPLMFVSDGVHVIYEDMLFSQFSAQYLSLGKNSGLIFGNNTTVELFRNEDLNYTWTFRGNTTIRGGGSILTLGKKGGIEVVPSSTLTIQGMTIKGVSGKKIRCVGNSSKVVFKDIKWIQSGDFEWAKGAFDVVGDFSIVGPYTFSYTSGVASTILSDATMSLRRGATFYYAPRAIGFGVGSALDSTPSWWTRAEKEFIEEGVILIGNSIDLVNSNRTLFKLKDVSSTLFMEDATFSAPAPGIKLTNGRLELSKFNYLRNDGGTDASNGIVFGDGTLAGNLTVDQPSSDALRTLSGVLTVQNVTGSIVEQLEAQYETSLEGGSPGSTPSPWVRTKEEVDKKK